MDFQIKKILDFINRDIWTFRIDEIPKAKSMLIKLLRVIVLAVKDFFRDQCQIRASALTFYSVLSVVPVVAMLFAVSKGFGLEERLRNSLMEKFGEPQQQEIIIQIFDFAEKMLNNAKGGVIAGIGVAVLFWTVVKLFTNIEISFNHIWRVKSCRKFWIKLRDYIIIVVFAAVAIILSSSLNVFISTQLSNIASRHEILKIITGPFIFVIIKSFPFVLMWMFFSTLYKFMPNTRVSYNSAIVAGIITGTVFQFIQSFFIYLQVMLSKTSAIYGSLSALPLFFIWTQITWLVVLFGAEISFAHQNSENFEFEVYTDKISHNAFKAYVIKTAAFLVQNFYHGNNPCTVGDISRICKMSIGLTRKVLYSLIDTKLVYESIEHNDEDKIVYQPSCNSGEITVYQALQLVDNRGMACIEKNDKDFNDVSQMVSNMEDISRDSALNITLKEIELSEELFHEI